MRRAGNPRLAPGQAFTDGGISVAIADPDVRWNADASRYELYYGAPHATAFGEAAESMIRRATSADRMAWTVDDQPALRVAADPAAWDSAVVEAPTVVYNPSAPPERRYLMMYAGARRPFPYPGYNTLDKSIGAAFSADGITFTRVPAAETPHGKDGLVMTGPEIYIGALAANVSDPELAFIDGFYHLWFSSFACDGASCANLSDRGVGHATSIDGIHWTLDAAPVRSLLRTTANRASGGSQPSVIYDRERCRYELWLVNDVAGEVGAQPASLDNAMGVFMADSSDGKQWSVRYDRARDLAWSASEDGEALGLHRAVDVAQNGTGRLMLYVGIDDANVPAGATVPARAGGTRAGITVLNVATRDLP